MGQLKRFSAPFSPRVWGEGFGEKRTKNRSGRSGVLGLVSRLNYKKRLPTPLFFSAKPTPFCRPFDCIRSAENLKGFMP